MADEEEAELNPEREPAEVSAEKEMLDGSLQRRVTRAERKAQDKNSFISFIKELPILIATAVVIALAVKTFIIQPFYIPSPSMVPTLEPGDQVLVSKFIYRFVEPEPGNIIVFVPPNNDNVDFIKRIVATEGDEVFVKEGKVYINDKPLRQDYKTGAGDMSTWGPQKVPKNHVFVMGDNRPNSMDSRVFGPVPEKNILGRAFMIHWPVPHMQILN